MINFKKYTFLDSVGVDKGPHLSTCTSWRGLVVDVVCERNNELERLPRIHPSQRDSFNF